MTYADSLAKASIVGGVAVAASYFMQPTGRINVSLLGTSLPLWVGTGLAVGLGSYGSELAHKLISRALHVSQRYSNTASSAVALESITAGNYGLLNEMNSAPSVQIGRIQIASFAMGAGIAGTYLYNTIVRPMAMDTY